MTPQDFQQTVLEYYHLHQRDLPWRHMAAGDTLDPYHVMVSEVMLQQTQVPRVIEKYREFLKLYPTIIELAEAPLQDVLTVWQGLGYNRRGRFLRDAAVMVVNEYGGVMPQTVSELTNLPGIGHNTASAIAVYAYNQPLVFIETNIRTVYLHHFFPDDEAVTDAAILELVDRTLFRDNPREWYWALMDYGTHIKRLHGNQNTRSKHYVKQSAFKGSQREVRGRVLKALTVEPHSFEALQRLISDQRLVPVLGDLQSEGLIVVEDTIYSIAA